MKLSDLRQLIGKVQDLPTLSRTVVRITDLINNPKASAKDLARVITDDQVLTARLLKMVNSSFYGFPQRISTVTNAIVLLGFDAIRNLLLTTSIFEVFIKSQSREGRVFQEKLWDHSLGCAVGAKVIGRRIGQGHVEEFFVAGLLHDIGKIVQMIYLQDDFKRVLHHAQTETVHIGEAERMLLGYTHADVGRLLGERWNLPDKLIQAIAFHHNPDQAGEFVTEASVVHLADTFCRSLQIGSGGDAKIPALNPVAWQQLGLSINEIGPMMSEIENSLSAVQDSLTI